MLAGLLISDIVNGPGVSTCDEKSVFDFILNIFLGVDISTFVVRHILRVRFYESHFFPIALVWYNSANIMTLTIVTRYLCSVICSEPSSCL